MTGDAQRDPIEWDARAYDVLSEPQVEWGRRILASLELRGDEVAIDAGCGTGRLTAELAALLPRGRVIALDRSPSMLEAARSRLGDGEGRFEFRAVDLQRLDLVGVADLVFSTATFHWIPDHPALFARLFDALRPGGSLVAQCGGRGNLDRFAFRLEAIVAADRRLAALADPSALWEFADAETTAQRLRTAGFVDVRTWGQDALARLGDRETYRRFVRTVILRAHLEQLDEATGEALLDAVADAAGEDEPAFTLDYRRLNMVARRPAAEA